MDLAKCLRCNKLFTKVRLPVCPDCEREEDKEIFEVQRYLRDHPNSTLDEVSDALNIYVEDIERWIQEKRLVVEIHSKAALKCAVCGIPITSGKVCGKCSERIFSEPEKEQEEKKTSIPGASSLREDGSDSSSIRKYRRE